MTILPAESANFEMTVPVLVIGAGACGLIAAMSAVDAGAEAVVLERDATPQGSTALSSGMIPAAGTNIQRDKGIEDTPELLIQDVMAKNHGLADAAMVEAIARASGPTVDWLTGEKGVELALVEGFLYPGTSRLRMHAPPDKTGASLMGSLLTAAEADGIDILTNALATALFADSTGGVGGRVAGVRIERPDGGGEDIGCQALILACNGFGGNPGMVREHIPEMTDALYFGHPGNRGEAMIWGRELGAAVRHMTAYQGHGSVAHPHSVLITWALMMAGGFQVNARGERFSNEHGGYSEQSVNVLAQPGNLAWNIFDARLHDLGMTFEDYRQAEKAGAVRVGETPEALAATLGLPPDALAQTIAATGRYAAAERHEAGKDSCPFGRDFTASPALAPPYYAIKVTGALFHTQGGLAVDTGARVLREDGTALPNLFAGGGAACGISGPEVWGYLSGNGLLAAANLGRIAGRSAALSLES